MGVMPAKHQSENLHGSFSWTSFTARVASAALEESARHMFTSCELLGRHRVGFGDMFLRLQEDERVHLAFNVVDFLSGSIHETNVGSDNG